METTKEQQHTFGDAKINADKMKEEQKKENAKACLKEHTPEENQIHKRKIAELIDDDLMNLINQTAKKHKDEQGRITIGTALAEMYLLGQQNNLYKTACESINKDNPLAVAEKLSETFSLIKKKAQIISYELSGEPSEENASCAKVLAEEIEELLTKIQEGKQ